MADADGDLEVIERHNLMEGVGRGATVALTIARGLSGVQGVVWLVLLLHGGRGLIFAPLALLAAVFGARYPVVGPLLLGPPLVWLTLSWAPILARTSAVGDWGVWAALVVPAVVAAGIFAVVAVQRFQQGRAT